MTGDNQQGENKENSNTNTETKAEAKTETKTEMKMKANAEKKEEKAVTKNSAITVERHNKSAKPVLSAVTSRLQMRKQSIGISAVMSVRRNEMASSQALEYKRPFIAYEPTYQLEPITRFDCHQVENLVNEVLDKSYEGHKYNDELTPALATNLSNIIMREVKHMLFNRYRILSIVAIGQRRAQSYNNTISFIWDPLRDAYADVHRANITTFIQVTVIGIYLD